VFNRALVLKCYFRKRMADLVERRLSSFADESISLKNKPSKNL